MKYKDDGGSTLSYITTGGKVEIYFFWKGPAKRIISDYQKKFGKPVMPSLWALGWHSSSTAFTSLDMIKENIDAYKKAELPLEGIWLDIHNNPKAFSGLKAFAQQIQNEGKKLVVTVDPGIVAEENNAYFREAKDAGVLI